MKWPSSLTLVRHGESQYNELRRRKDKDERYKLFKKAFNRDPGSPECRDLALEMRDKYNLGVSDYATPLTEAGRQQAFVTGTRMKASLSPPDVAVVSPYHRTRDTFLVMASAWPELQQKAMVYYDDRIREQEHGLSLLYNDWRVFEVVHPEQRGLRKLLGPYWYQYPQGESAAQTRERVRSMMNTVIREWSGLNVLMVTHHLTILSVRANLERLSSEDFIRLDEEEKPRNCGVTIYRGNPERGANGKLELELYNRCFWEEGGVA